MSCSIHNVTHYGVTYVPRHPGLICTCSLGSLGSLRSLRSLGMMFNHLNITSSDDEECDDKPPAKRPRTAAAVIVRANNADHFGEWALRRISRYLGPKARTAASAVCVAFYGPANSVKRTVTFGRELLIVDGRPTLKRLERARERFPELCVNAINLTGCPRGCKIITDIFIVNLVGICPEIEDVVLTRCKRLTDASIVALAGSCPLLKSVDLSSCELLTDASIGALAGSCPLLKSVNLTCCELLTDASIVALAGNCPLLESVDLGDASCSPTSPSGRSRGAALCWRA